MTGIDADVSEIHVVEAPDRAEKRTVAAENDHALGISRRAVIFVGTAAHGARVGQMPFDKRPQREAFIPRGVAVEIKAFHPCYLIPAPFRLRRGANG